MKNPGHFIFILVSLTFACLIQVSCDKIDEPFLRHAGLTPIDTTDTVVKKVLLEDFTGHRCPNCPGAAKTAHDLLEIYGDRLIIITVHAGFQATPFSTGLYTYDFRTPEGNELDAFFAISTGHGNPSGMVDRRNWVNAQPPEPVADPDDWAEYVGREMDSLPQVQITQELDFIAAEREVYAEITVKFIDNLMGKFHLCCFITEDSVIKPQANNDTLLGTVPDIEEYVHMHVLRGSLNGTWGELISADTVFIAGSEFTLNYPDYHLDAEWKEKDCHIVSFVFNENTKEVLQAEQSPLMAK
jgi:hypothetical protein